MNAPEKLLLPVGSMVNYANHEDDEALTLVTSVEAEILGEKIDGGIPVRILTLDPERTYFIHQPEV